MLTRSYYNNATPIHPTPTSLPPLTIHAYHTHTPHSHPTDDVPSLTPTGSNTSSSITQPSLLPPPSTVGLSCPTTIQGYSINAACGGPPPSITSTQPNPTCRTAQPHSLGRYKGACEACGKYRHPAACCDMLTMALFLQLQEQDQLGNCQRGQRAMGPTQQETSPT